MKNFQTSINSDSGVKIHDSWSLFTDLSLFWTYLLYYLYSIHKVDGLAATKLDRSIMKSLRSTTFWKNIGAQLRAEEAAAAVGLFDTRIFQNNKWQTTREGWRQTRTSISCSSPIHERSDRFSFSRTPLELSCWFAAFKSPGSEIARRQNIRLSASPDRGHRRRDGPSRFVQLLMRASEGSRSGPAWRHLLCGVVSVRSHTLQSVMCTTACACLSLWLLYFTHSFITDSS